MGASKAQSKCVKSLFDKNTSWLTVRTQNSLYFFEYLSIGDLLCDEALAGSLVTAFYPYNLIIQLAPLIRINGDFQ